MSVLRMSTGRSFQIVGPETRKLRQPKRDSTRVDNLNKTFLPDDCVRPLNSKQPSCWQILCSLRNVIKFCNYVGLITHVWRKNLNAAVASLGLVSHGAAIDGVTLFFLAKKLRPFSVIAVCTVMTFFSCRLLTTPIFPRHLSSIFFLNSATKINFILVSPPG